jgi:hypothetical protein
MHPRNCRSIDSSSQNVSVQPFPPYQKKGKSLRIAIETVFRRSGLKSFPGRPSPRIAIDVVGPQAEAMHGWIASLDSIFGLKYPQNINDCVGRDPH